MERRWGGDLHLLSMQNALLGSNFVVKGKRERVRQLGTGSERRKSAEESEREKRETGQDLARVTFSSPRRAQ
ncbi:hypothetical protein R1flu_009904 [Riccia fluitans]|uniref:Uncharacterized protein n=1 Tax=Riccia fluitans TaxID=41844 RepID=A0ABD1Z7Q7_9MARC